MSKELKASFVSSHGVIAYEDSQQGSDVLIFMHGLPTSGALWYPVLPHLFPNYRTITFDLNDYGESEKIGRSISHRERADVLGELRHHLNVTQFHLVAHDLGSSVAIDYLGKYARHVQSLVIIPFRIMESDDLAVE